LPPPVLTNATSQTDVATQGEAVVNDALSKSAPQLPKSEAAAVVAPQADTAATAEIKLPEPSVIQTVSVPAQAAEPVKPVELSKSAVESVAVKPTPAPSHLSVTEKAPKTPKPTKQKPDAGENRLPSWIDKQPGNHYSLQVMVLTQRQALNQFLRRHHQYQDALKYYLLDDKPERYAVIYGSFKTKADALAAKKAMPKEFSESLVTRFAVIQKHAKSKE
jgi:septal ring-binding cell division protein DamX